MQEMDVEYKAYVEELQRKKEFLLYNCVNPVYPQYDRETARYKVNTWEPERIEQMYDMVCYMNKHRRLERE